jgi:1,4-dihydroxy-2-naphthoyl-CoA synthase
MAISEKSLANLKTISSPEMANEYREKGLVTRIENKKKRELAKENILAMKELGEEAPSAIEALKYVLTQAMESNDTEQIIKVSSILAEYQAPKLSRQDVTQTNINAEDLTDEELEKELEGLTLN